MRGALYPRVSSEKQAPQPVYSPVSQGKLKLPTSRLKVLLSKQATEGGYLIARLYLHHAHALRVSTNGWDIIDGGSYYYPFSGYEHKTLTGVNN